MSSLAFSSSVKSVAFFHKHLLPALQEEKKQSKNKTNKTPNKTKL